MVHSIRIRLLGVAVMGLALLYSCGGGGSGDLGSGSVLDLGDLVPEIQIQSVDHGYRVAGWSDLDLDPDPIFSLLASARSSLDIAVTRINRQEVVDSLLVAAAGGVQVRIVTEKAFYDSFEYKPFYDQLEDPARNGGHLQIRTDHEGLPRSMGSRFIVIDHSRVITGSYNWETLDSQNTFGDIINILNTDVAAVFTNQFNQMFVEGNFGAFKRDDTQHSFLVGSANGTPFVDNGILEVYFGPTNPLREHIRQVLFSSNEVFFMVQQFSDQNIFNDMLSWLNTPPPEWAPEKKMVGMINDIGALGSGAENQVYYGLLQWMEDPTDGVNLYLNDLIDPTGEYLEFDTMNHKHFYGDGLYGSVPTVVFTTGNYANPDLSQNDEVMLIFRGQPLVRKFFRGTDPLDSRLPDDVDESNDIEEFDQILAMFPYISNPDDEAPLLRNFSQVPCGIVFGTVANFRETVNMPSGDNQDVEEIQIDLAFSVKGELFFGATIGALFGNDDPEAAYPVFPEDVDNFERSELLNPKHSFIMVVPAGEITLITTVTELNGDPNSRFEPDERIFTIGPGGVRKLKLSINQQSSNDGAGGFGV